MAVVTCRAIIGCVQGLFQCGSADHPIRQGHAGTVPMKIRKDCIAAAAEAIAWMERRCGGGYYEDPHPATADLKDTDMLVCTTGAMTIWPGAS